MQCRDPRTVRKVVILDDHICLAFAGAQSHRLTIEDPVTVEYITKHIAGIKQKYTQSSGVRPFGVSTLIANAIGRSSTTVREFLEKNHKDDLTRDESIGLTVKSFLEVVQTGAKNIEISVMEVYGEVMIEAIVSEIEREKEAGRF
ncbi:nucleophile aminohydrolase [Mycena rosella]|uniref:Nucleophile aminohydrolase n=1 Tax=Mycena rosella TaxID=1033263 RepID=A0AAD7MB14_MYCRO|nr:nucleophile aminohydrolase [Mycena rosella]